MKYAYLIILIMYSLLMIVSVAAAKKLNIKLRLLMFSGSGFVLTFSIIRFFLVGFSVILIIGLVIIHIAAILNGISIRGKIKLSHHIVRTAISVTFIVLSFFL